MYRKSICVHHTLCIYIILSYRFHVHIWNKNRKLITIYLRLSTYIIPPPVSPRSLNFCTLTLFPSPFWIFQSLPYYCISLPSPSVFPLLPSCTPLPHLLYLPYITFCISPTSPSVCPLPHLLYLSYLTFCISPYLTFRISPISPSVSPFSLNFCILPLPHSQSSTPFPIPPTPPSPLPPLPTLVFSVYIQFVTLEGKEWLCNGGLSNEREI